MNINYKPYFIIPFISLPTFCLFIFCVCSHKSNSHIIVYSSHMIVISVYVFTDKHKRIFQTATSITGQYANISTVFDTVIYIANEHTMKYLRIMLYLNFLHASEVLELNYQYISVNNLML